MTSIIQTITKCFGKGKYLLMAASAAILISGCSSINEVPTADRSSEVDFDYLIGPGDQVEVFVWGNQELTTSVQVRPDGKITTRLVENIPASGKTPSDLARDIEQAYGEYVKHPVVSVIVNGFIGVPTQQIRVVGEAAKPLKIPFTKHMSLLDLMIEVGGLTEFAAGNKAVLIRTSEQGMKSYALRLEDLLEDGDISANLSMHPGDIVMIPESWF